MRRHREDEADVLVFVGVRHRVGVGRVCKAALELRYDLSYLKGALKVVGAHEARHREDVDRVEFV